MDGNRRKHANDDVVGMYDTVQRTPWSGNPGMVCVCGVAPSEKPGREMRYAGILPRAKGGVRSGGVVHGRRSADVQVGVT